MRTVALVTTVLLTLTACGSDAPSEGTPDGAATPDDAAAADDREPGADDEGGQDGAATDAGTLPADGDPGVVLTVAGQQLAAGPDATVWGCATTADASLVSFQFLDADGNDVSVNHQAGGETTASLTLADGTRWQAVEGGTVEVVQASDGTYGVTIEVAEGSSGESALLEGSLRC